MPSKKGKYPTITIGFKIEGELGFENLFMAKKFIFLYTTVVSNHVQRLPERVDTFGKTFMNIFIAIKV